MDKILCIKCQSALTADNVNIHTGLAQCDKCKAIFYLRKPDSEPNYDEQKVHDASYKNVERPKSLSVTNEGMRLILRYHTGAAAGCVLLFFAIIWSGISLTMFGFVLLDRNFFVMLFLLPFILIGVILFYAGMVSLLNSHYIIIEQGTLKVKSRPLPVPGSKTVPTQEIRQVYVKDIRSDFFQQRDFESSKDGRHAFFNLVYKARTGTDTTLLALPDINVALYMERAIEKYLGIQDSPVNGEVKL